MGSSQASQREFFQAGTAVDHIKNIRMYREKIASIEERIARLRSAMEMGSRQLTGMPRNTDVQDRLANDIVRLDALERQLIGETLRFEIAVAEAEQAIDRLPGAQRIIMRLRYIEGLSWRRVSEKSFYGIRHCFKLHDKALRSL